jgi:hypothetical protein
LVFVSFVAGAQTQPQEFTICPNGCQSIALPAGNQLLAEGGTQPNHAGLIGTDVNGDQLAVPFLNGLPSGQAWDGVPFGPVAYALNGRNLYIALSEADPFHSGGPTFIRRAAPAPFAAALIQVTFSADLYFSGPFNLNPQAGAQLLNGQTVTVWDFSGNSVTLVQIASLGVGTHPVGVATLPSAPNTVYVVDSGTKRLLAIDRAAGQVSTVAQFPTAPESLRPFDDHELLVSFFDPAPNASSVWVLDPVAGTSRLLAGSLTAAVDAVSAFSSSVVFVLENTGDPQGLGQVLAVNAAGVVTGTLTDGLNDPTSIWVDEFTGRLFVYSRGDGVVYSVPAR